jgi:hypothetical protein
LLWHFKNNSSDPQFLPTHETKANAEWYNYLHDFQTTPKTIWNSHISYHASWQVITLETVNMYMYILYRLTPWFILHRVWIHTTIFYLWFWD